MKVCAKELRDIETSDEMVYSSSDYSLDINLKYSTQEESSLRDNIDKNFNINKIFLLHYENLTISFSGDDLNLVKIDAFTASLNWAKERVAVPVDLVNGICYLDDITSDADDRLTIAFEPIFKYDISTSTIKIMLNNENSVSNIQNIKVSPNVIIGLANDTFQYIIILNLALYI